MKAVYPPAQVAPYDSSFFGASPPATRWTKLATRAASGPAVTAKGTREVLKGLEYTLKKCVFKKVAFRYFLHPQFRT